jgi:hypothetical protein
MRRREFITFLTPRRHARCSQNTLLTLLSKASLTSVGYATVLLWPGLNQICESCHAPRAGGWKMNSIDNSALIARCRELASECLFLIPAMEEQQKPVLLGGILDEPCGQNQARRED